MSHPYLLFCYVAQLLEMHTMQNFPLYFDVSLFSLRQIADVSNTRQFISTSINNINNNIIQSSRSRKQIGDDGIEKLIKVHKLFTVK